MSTSLPDLSSWHPVPVGATVPAGTIVATVYPDEAIIIGTAANDTHALHAGHMYTAEPIAVPLPVEEGAKIIAQFTSGLLRELILRGGHWTYWAVPGYIIHDQDIIRWAPAPTEWHER